MTSEQFWTLYESGAIQCKVFEGQEEDVRKEVTAFEYNGKFYLRITKQVDGKGGYSELRHKKTHSRGWINTQIKEFETKTQANNYFKKAGAGLNRVK